MTQDVSKHCVKLSKTCCKAKTGVQIQKENLRHSDKGIQISTQKIDRRNSSTNNNDWNL